VDRLTSERIKQMPISLTVPIVQASVANYVITSVTLVLEPALQITVIYSPADALGNPTSSSPGGVAVVLGGPAMATYTATAGGPKAKFYAALQTQLGVTGTVT
jgi:hypothetical protein